MVIGDLVKNSHGLLGTVIKVTPYVLSHDDWKKSRDDEVDAAIRPGYIASVRWQEDVTQMSNHVFYQGFKSSVLDMGTTFRDVEVVENESR